MYMSTVSARARARSQLARIKHIYNLAEFAAGLARLSSIDARLCRRQHQSRRRVNLRSPVVAYVRARARELTAKHLQPSELTANLLYLQNNATGSSSGVVVAEQ